MSLILGIDPGSRITGYGIIKTTGSTKNYIASGCIKTQDGSLPSRLHEIYKGLDTIIETYKPAIMAIEEVFVAHNPLAALKLGQARGVAIVVGTNHGLHVSEYAAREVKKAVVGTGAASKNQVQHMVKILLKLPALPQADAADALAVALCHINQQKYLLKLAQK